MTEILILVWDRYINVTGLNHLTRTQPSPIVKNTDNNNRKTAQIRFNPKTTRFDCVYLKIAQNVNIYMYFTYRSKYM